MATVEERKQQAVEQLLTDSSLTDNLDDKEANRLIEWANGLAGMLAMHTVAMGDEQADEYLSTRLGDLRKMLRGINKLGGNLPDAGEEEVAAQLDTLFAQATEIPVLRCALPENVREYAKKLQGRSPDIAVGSLLATLSGLPPEEDDTSGLWA